MAGVMTQTAFVGSRVAIKTRTPAPTRNVTVRAAAKFAGNWLPGSTQPAYLEGLPGAYGFVRPRPSQITALPATRKTHTQNLSVLMSSCIHCCARLELRPQLFKYGMTCVQDCIVNPAPYFYRIFASFAHLSVPPPPPALPSHRHIPPPPHPDLTVNIIAPAAAAQDPLKLASTDASLQRFRESEVIHGRWAMLGVAGALAVEVLGLGNWYEAPLWVRRCPAQPCRPHGSSLTLCSACSGNSPRYVQNVDAVNRMRQARFWS